MKFKEIRVVYADGLFDSITETSIDSVIDNLKKEDMLNELEYLQIFLK